MNRKNYICVFRSELLNSFQLFTFKRKLVILDSTEIIFYLHSGATERKNYEK